MHRRQILNSMFGLIILSQVVCLWILPSLPFQDYYEWLLQSKIFFNLLTSDGFTQQYYTFSFSPVPPPNTLLTVFMAILQFLVSTKIAGKITLTIYILLFNTGFYRYCQKIFPENPFRFLGLLFVFNYFFYMGFLSYILGMAILFWFLPIFSTEIPPLKKKVIHILFASVILYLIHGFAFGVFTIALFIWLVKINWKKFKMSNSLPYILALLPAVILSLIYFFNVSPSSKQPVEFYSSIYPLFQGLRYGISIYQRIVLMKAHLPLTVLNLLFICTVFYIFISRRKYVVKNSLPGLFFIVFSIIMIFNPISRISDFYPPNPRFFLLIILVLSASFSFPAFNKKLENLILIMGFLVTFFHILIFYQYHHQNYDNIHKLKTEYISSSSPLILGKIYPDDFDKSPLHVFSGIVQPYIHISKMFNQDSIFTFLSIHQIGIIKVLNNDETRIKSRVEESFIAAQRRKVLFHKVSLLKSTISSHYDDIFLFGPETTRKKVEGQFYPEYTLKSKTAIWSSLQKAKN